MRRFFGLIVVAIGGVLLAVGRFTVALANGEDVHIGAAEIPALVLWIGGGGLGALGLFFLIGWGLSHRARRRRQNGESKGEPPEEKERQT